MKTLLSVLFVLFLVVACNAQPRSDYEIYSNPVVGATKYHFFLEKQSTNPYQLIQEMDYHTVMPLKVGEGTTPVFTINLANDGSEYSVGVVAEDSQGFYSGMGVGIATIGKVPLTPALIGLRKK
jgi:hypothetical protein